MKHLVLDGELHFQFKIKRKDDDEFTKKKLVDNVKVVSPPIKPAVANFPFKNKGTAKTNTVKKNGTVPTIIQPVLKPLQTDTATLTDSVSAAPIATASQRSSINARPDKNLESPCYSPSINKDDDNDVISFEMLSPTQIVANLMSYRYDEMIFCDKV